MQNIILGKIGESLAEKFLKDNNYKIVKKNYKNCLGEIDIIAYDNNEKYLVFIEVKARKTAMFGLPREAVNFNKQRKIKQVAMLYLKSTNKIEANVRFDVIDILNDEITHIKNAF